MGFYWKYCQFQPLDIHFKIGRKKPKLNMPYKLSILLSIDVFACSSFAESILNDNGIINDGILNDNGIIIRHVEKIVGGVTMAKLLPWRSSLGSMYLFSQLLSSFSSANGQNAKR